MVASPSGPVLTILSEAGSTTGAKTGVQVGNPWTTNSYTFNVYMNG